MENKVFDCDNSMSTQTVPWLEDKSFNLFFNQMMKFVGKFVPDQSPSSFLPPHGPGDFFEWKCGCLMWNAVSPGDFLHFELVVNVVCQTNWRAHRSKGFETEVSQKRNLNIGKKLSWLGRQ